jgi:hypothetical protein
MADIILTNNNQSPFDSILRQDADGEYWSARDLQPLLGYTEWRKFCDAIDRAKISIESSASRASDHIVGSDKLIEAGKGATRRVLDYRLSRFGAYMVAMNGDPRKVEIAQAQTYFAIKTREAEIAKELPAPTRPPKELPSAVEYVEAKKYLDSRPRDRFTALAEQLLIAEMAGLQNAQNLLPSAEPPKHYTTVMIRAAQLGYSAKQIDGGVSLGKFVKAAIQPDHKDWQGQYQVWQYEVTEELDSRIHSFFLTRAL